MDPQEGMVILEDLEPPEPKASPEDPLQFARKCPNRPAYPAHLANLEAKDHLEAPETLDKLDTPDEMETTDLPDLKVPQDLQVKWAPQERTDHEESQEDPHFRSHRRQETQEHQESQECQDCRETRDNQDATDSREAQDRWDHLDPLDLKDRLETEDWMESRECLEFREREVSARNTALWTAESSSRTAPDDKFLEIRHLFQYFIFIIVFQPFNNSPTQKCFHQHHQNL